MNLQSMEYYPTSHHQRDILLDIELVPEMRKCYYILLLIDVDQHLNVDIFEKAFMQIIETYPILRSNYVRVDSEYKMIFPPHKKHIVNYCEMLDADYSTVKDKFKKKIFDRELNIGNDLLVDYYMTRYNDHRTAIFYLFNHLICDGYSITMVIDEISKNYKYLIENKTPRPIDHDGILHYTDCVLLEHETLSKERLIDDIKTWVDKLKGTIFTEFPRRNKTFNGEQTSNFNKNSIDTTKVIYISCNNFGKIENICKDANVSPFTFFYTVFSLILKKYLPDRDNICVTIPTSNRLGYAPLLDVIGMIANMIVIPSETYDSDTSFIEMLKNNSLHIRSLLKISHVPLSFIIDAMEIKKNFGKKPFSEICFAYQKLRKTNIDFGSNINSETSGLMMGASQYNMIFELYQCDNLPNCSHGIKGQIEYNPNVHGPKLIDQFLDDFENTIINIIDNYPSKFEISNINPSIVMQSKNIIDRSPSEPWPKLFENMVKIYGDKIAIYDDDDCITYENLNKKANKVAHWLINNACNKGDIVEVFFDRTIDMFIYLIGIMKAGCAYIPIGLDIPEERIKSINSQISAKIFICDNQNHYDLIKKLYPNAKILSTFDNADKQSIDVQAIDNPIVELNCDDLGYVIATSGTSGVPKIVLQRHGALDIFTYYAESLNISDKHVFSFISSYTFDSSLIEIFLPLQLGASIVIIKKDESLNGKILAYKIEKFGINFMESTPTIWKILINYGWLPNKNMTVITEGDFIPYNLCKTLLNHCDNVINLYGPTEFFMPSWSKLKLSDDGTINIDDIGYPHGHNSYMILDSKKNIVPMGIYGNLYMSGSCIARGYANPEITKKYFKPNPYSTSNNDKIMYRTGDSVVMVDDKKFLLSGRMDGQVRIGGARIERKEIEYIVRSNNHIIDCISLVHESGKFILFCITDNQITKDNLYFHIAKFAPKYMIPSVIIFMNQFPINASHKIDVNLLKYYNIDIISETTDNSNNGIELLLVKLLAPIFNKNKIGVSDNFFVIGGTSVEISYSKGLIYKEFNIDIPLNFIYDSPTIEMLAKYIQHKSKITINEPIDNVHNSIKEFNVSSLQRKYLEYYRKNPASKKDILHSVMTINHPLDHEKLKKCIDDVSMRHTILRTKYFIDNNIWMQKIEEYPTYKIIPDISNIEINLENGICMNILVDEFNFNKFKLAIIIHHICVDMWSYNLLYEEIIKLYLDKNIDSIDNIPQYYEYNEKYHDSLSITNEKILFWGEYLRNYNFSANEKYNDNIDIIETQNIDKYCIDKIKNKSSIFKTTPYIFNLACFADLLHNNFNIDDIVIIIPFSVRPIPEFSSTIGYFAEYVPIRIKWINSFDGLINNIITNYQQLHKSMISFADIQALHKTNNLMYFVLNMVSLKSDKFDELGCEIDINHLKTIEGRNAMMHITIIDECDKYSIMGGFSAKYFKRDDANIFMMKYINFLNKKLDV